MISATSGIASSADDPIDVYKRQVQDGVDHDMADGEVVLHRSGEDVGGFNAGLGREGIHEVRVPEALRGSAVHKHVGVDGIADDDVAVEHAEAVEHDGHRVILHLGEGIRLSLIHI